MNLDEMSLRELKDLQKQIAKIIDGFQERQKRDAVAKLAETARTLGFTIEELFGQPPAKAPRKSAEAKYHNPENPEMTWSGRGRKPGWFDTAILKGITRDDMLIR
jgi:DNA-binding protein H-NS